jgi:NhaP-type Na+/H+ and K+/H+ antiporter
MQIELFLLVLSTLFFASILAGSRFGVPALLLFLALGMLFGSDGLGVSAPDDAPKPPKRPWYSVLFDDSE